MGYSARHMYKAGQLPISFSRTIPVWVTGQ
jgi:hypothetical protein